MTIGELERALDSRRRVKEVEAQEKASFDYILADLIGRSLGRFYSSSNKMPEITEAYPNLFSNEQIQEIKKQKQAELSAIRLRQFAQLHNKKYEGGEQNINE